MVTFALVYRLELQHGLSVSVSQLEGVCGGVCLALRWCRGGSYLHARESQVLPGGEQISWRHVWVKAVTVSPSESERVMALCPWPHLSGPIIFTFSTCQTNQEHFDIFQQMKSSLNRVSHAIRKKKNSLENRSIKICDSRLAATGKITLWSEMTHHCCDSHHEEIKGLH